MTATSLRWDRGVPRSALTLPGDRLGLPNYNRNKTMPYFTRSQNRIDRGGKLVADIFCALLLLALGVACFGLLGGLLAFVVLEGALLVVDDVVPSSDDDPGGAVG